MRTIQAAVPLAESILGKSVLHISQPCRPLTYLVRAEHADGTLLYNVMTKAIVLLTAEEASLFDALPAEFTEAYQALADMWFIVPADNDDMALSDGLKNVVMALDSQPKPLTSYTIFTTTYCDERDEQKLAEWRKVLPKQPECASCFHYPACVRLAHCPNRTEYCNVYMRGSGLVKLRASLLATYERCLSKLPAEQDESDNPEEC